MKLRTVALLGVVSLATLGLIGAGARGVFTTSTLAARRSRLAPSGLRRRSRSPTRSTTPPTGPTGRTRSPARPRRTPGRGPRSATVSSPSRTPPTGIGGTDLNFGASAETFNEASGTAPPGRFALGRGASPRGHLQVIAKATDSLGFVGTSSTVTFTYETTSPTVAITYPVNGTTYGTNWGGAITGTAGAKATGATIKTMQVSIQQVGGDCWTGSGNNYSDGLSQLRSGDYGHDELVAQCADF